MECYYFTALAEKTSPLKTRLIAKAGVREGHCVVHTARDWTGRGLYHTIMYHWHYYEGIIGITLTITYVQYIHSIIGITSAV